MVDKLVVIRWLLNNVSVLREISAIASGWSDSASLSQKLEVVYKVAQALLPVIESFPLFQAQALPVTQEEADEELRTVEAMGLPSPECTEELLGQRGGRPPPLLAMPCNTACMTAHPMPRLSFFIFSHAACKTCWPLWQTTPTP